MQKPGWCKLAGFSFLKHMPAFTEQLEPERTILALSFEKIGDKYKDEGKHY